MNVWFLRLSVIYLAIGVLFGLVMGITERLQFAPVHTHINLLGWATLALAGVIYTIFPQAGNNKLAVWHFWFHNIGLPVFVIGLYCMIAQIGGSAAEQFVKVGAVIAIIGILIFLVNVLANVRPGARA